MIDPATIGAGIGLVSSLFGGKPKTPGYVKANYRLQNGIMQRAVDLYDNADLEGQDAAAVASYGDAVMRRAMTTLGNYDARAAGAGSPLGKMDTQKGRARAQVAGDAATQVSELEANLAQTRAARRAALLPNASQAAAGAQSAYYLDQQGAGEQGAQMQGLLAASQLVSSYLTPNRFKSRGSGRNDGLALNLANPNPAQVVF